MKLYNPKNGHTFDTATDDDLHNQVYLEAGWVEAPPDPEPEPGLEAEPVTYAPVEPKKPAAKKTAVKDEPAE